MHHAGKSFHPYACSSPPGRSHCDHAWNVDRHELHCWDTEAEMVISLIHVQQGAVFNGLQCEMCSARCEERHRQSPFPGRCSDASGIKGAAVNIILGGSGLHGAHDWCGELLHFVSQLLDKAAEAVIDAAQRVELLLHAIQGRGLCQGCRLPCMQALQECPWK